MSDLERTKSLAELGLMLDPLEGAGRTVTLDEKNVRLVIALDDDEQRDRPLHISMVPFGEPGDSALRLVRFDVTFPFEVHDGSDADVTTALPILSAHLAVGAFHRDDDGSLHLAYTLATDASSTIDDDVLVAVVELIDAQQEQLGDYLEGVCTDEVAVEVLPQVIAAGEA